MRSAILAVALITISASAAAQEDVPSVLTAPAAFTIEAVTAARGNVTRWTAAERERLGTYISNNQPRPIPNLEGYFAILDDPSYFPRPGIVHGVWSNPTGDPLRGNLRGEYLQPYSVCGATVPLGGFFSDRVVYLGADPSADFAALDAALASARTSTGRTIAGTVIGVPYDPPIDGMVFARHYPPQAQDRGMSGDADIDCLVQDDRSLRCGVSSESPPGWGFGLAAVRALQSGSVRVAATAEDGAPSPGLCIHRRVRFRLS